MATQLTSGHLGAHQEHAADLKKLYDLMEALSSSSEYDDDGSIGKPL